MTGRNSFEQLVAKMPPERRARNEAETRRMLRELTLQELREARERSQAQLAAQLGVGQPAVAKMERRTDLYVSSLRRYVEALGGTLEITARFPDLDVPIKAFEDLAPHEAREAPPAAPPGLPPGGPAR